MAVKPKVDTGYNRTLEEIIQQGKDKVLSNYPVYNKEPPTSSNATADDSNPANEESNNATLSYGGRGSYSSPATSAMPTGASTSTNHIAQAQAVLNNRQYQSNWQNQINDYLGQIQNRDPFSYDLNADALYRQYAEDYIRQGKMAMMDTMGQAAALTGGYGNSYAQNVGQQAYNQHVSQIQNIVPDLYNMALNRYIAEGDRLQGNLSMLMQQENQDYNRFYDRLAQQDNAYNRLMTMMTNFGYIPTKEELAYAGMTETEMKKIMGMA